MVFRAGWRIPIPGGRGQFSAHGGRLDPRTTHGAACIRQHPRHRQAHDHLSARWYDGAVLRRRQSTDPWKPGGLAGTPPRTRNGDCRITVENRVIDNAACIADIDWHDTVASYTRSRWTI